MCNFIYIRVILVLCGKCYMCLHGYVLLFCVSNLEFLAERWERCGWVMEDVVNDSATCNGLTEIYL
jgi:hypothetical protein